MPTKRRILEQLKRNELLAAVERFELEVADRRVRDLLIDALASSRTAPIDEILAPFYRDRLKELCRALGLDSARPGGPWKRPGIKVALGSEPAAPGASNMVWQHCLPLKAKLTHYPAAPGLCDGACAAV